METPTQDPFLNNFLCEVKSVAIYRNSNNCTIYLTVKNVSTKTIFAGRLNLPEPPLLLLDEFIQVIPAKTPTDQTHYKHRVGNDLQSKLIDRYQLLKISNVNGSAEFVSTKNVQQ